MFSRISLVHFRWFITGAIFVVCLVVWSIVFAHGGHELRVSFLDIGQGDAIFIEAPSGNQLLLDGGPDKKILSRLGDVMPWYDRSIDMLALSHPHADHLVGLLAVLDRYAVGAAVDSGTQYDTTDYRSWREMLLQKKISETALHAGDRIDMGDGVTLDALLPNKDVSKATPHEGMLVLQLRYGSTTVMLTGDMEENLESELVFANDGGLASDVLKVGHHGSRTSTSLQFLDAVHPKYAVVSVGAGNKYGHPNSEVMGRLAGEGISTFRTDKDGTVTLRSDGEHLSVVGSK